MRWNRTRDTVLNGLVGVLVGLAVARIAGREDTTRVALLVGLLVAAINWLGYEKPAVLTES